MAKKTRSTVEKKLTTTYYRSKDPNELLVAVLSMLVSSISFAFF
jgi:hypothetical protein